MSVDRRRRIAVHESGHATVARLLRLPGCGEAVAGPDEGHAVFCDGHGAASIVAIMAGAASEIELLGAHDEDGIAVDAALVRERLQYYGYDADLLWNWTVDFVRLHRGRIAHLAIKLKRAGMLDGRAIDRVVWRG